MRLKYVSVYMSCYNKILQTVAYKQQDLNSHRFKEWEVWDQGANMPG